MDKPFILSAEARLVFRSADPDATTEELLAIAAEVQDWERALVMAEHEGATGAIWRALQPRAAQIPREAADFLRTRTMLNDFRMQRLAARLTETARALADARIPVVLLKGAAVGAIADPTFCARPMSDLDLLVREADVGAARDAVIATGWRETDDQRLHRLMRGQHHLPPFSDPQLAGLRLELHTAILAPDHPFSLSMDQVWSLATPAGSPFAGASVLPLPHTVLHSAVHFAWQHSMTFGAWRTFRGVALMLRVPGWQWGPFVELAQRTKARTACYWTLRLAERLCGIGVPREILNALAPPNAAWVMRALDRHFIAQLVSGESPASPSSRVSRWLWLVALRPQWSGHPAPGRLDTEHRWEREFGRLSAEGPVAKARRHASAYRAWWQFVSRTLRG